MSSTASSAPSTENPPRHHWPPRLPPEGYESTGTFRCQTSSRGTFSALRARETLDLFRGEESPVFHIRHLSVLPDATFFLPGTPGAKIHELVHPLPNETVIVKHFPNSLRAPLITMLEAAGIERLAICGVMTSMCVDATARAALGAVYCRLLQVGEMRETLA